MFTAAAGRRSVGSRLPAGGSLWSWFGFGKLFCVSRGEANDMSKPFSRLLAMRTFKKAFFMVYSTS